MNRPEDPAPAQETFYEAWAILDKRFSLKIKTFQLFGLKLKIKENNLADLDSYSGLAATQSELKSLIAQLRPISPLNQSSSTLQQLTALSSGCARTVTHLISIRANATKYAVPPRTWAIELLVPWSSLPSSSAPKLAQNIDIGILKSQDPGYLLVLRSPGNKDDQLTIPTPDFNPFRGEEIMFAIGNRGERIVDRTDDRDRRDVYGIERPNGRAHHRDTEFEFVRKGRDRSSSVMSSSRSWPRIRETARKTTRDEDVEARQKEAVIAVNDFLATFSSLYDDVPEDERTKVLDSVAVPVVEEEDIWGSERDDDSRVRRSHWKRSTRSSSLADD
jgi:hypothetical protein